MPGSTPAMFAPHGPGSREYLAVEAGTLRLTLDGERVDLAVRRQRLLRRRLPARLRQPGAEGVRVLPRMDLAGVHGTSRGDGVASGGWTAEEVRRVGHRVGRHHRRATSPTLPQRPGVPALSRRRGRPDARSRYRARRERIDALLDEFSDRHRRVPVRQRASALLRLGRTRRRTLLGVFAEALAAAMNPSVAGGNHAAVHIEHQVVRWFAELAGLPRRQRRACS